MHLHLVCFILGSYLISSILASLDAEYHHSSFLDPDEIYKLYWTVEHGNKTIHFAVEVKTAGWVGFGISQGISGRMKGADIVIGWVDSKGKGHLSDRYATSNSMPLVDQHQDYELTEASQDNGTTILKFKRKLKTCDKNDRDIPLGTTKVIYAYGKTDNVKYHGFSTRGAKSLNLMTYVENSSPPANVKHFDVTIKNVSIPKKKTTYYCEAFKLSNLVKLQGKRHVVEIQPLVSKKYNGIVHHIVLYACRNDFDEKYLHSSGPCYDRESTDSIRRCAGQTGIFAWALGGLNFKFPNHVGFPIGSPNSIRYIVLETHFANSEMKANYVVTSGLRFFYDVPRKYDAGFLTTGSDVCSAIVIPPRQKDWIISGYCPKECSSKIAGPGALKGNEIKMFASFPHAHSASTGIWTKIVRNGTEVGEVIRDENYDFHYQQMHLLTKEITFKAGDDMITYCRYNSMKRQYATIGGLSSNDEMCLNYILYYPAVNFTTCVSCEVKVYPEFSKFYARPIWEDKYFGIKYNKSAPPVSRQFSNWSNVTWNMTMVQQLKKAYKTNGPNSLFPFCDGSLGVSHKMRMTEKPEIRRRAHVLGNSCKNKSGDPAASQ